MELDAQCDALHLGSAVANTLETDVAQVAWHAHAASLAQSVMLNVAHALA